MSYFSGDTDIPVKPVTRRMTFTRGKHRQVGRRYLQKTGRRPLNRRGYPVMGTPVAADMSMQPGHFGGEQDDAFSMKGLNPLTRNAQFILAAQTHSGRRILTRPYDPYASVSLGASIPDDAFSMKGLNPLTRNAQFVLAAQTRSGRRILTRPYDPYASVSLGASILDPISIMSNYVPGIPSVVAAPTSQPSSAWDIPAAIVNLWNSRPDVVKKIKVRVNPAKVAQQVLSPSQVQAAFEYARSVGIDPSYNGMPITGYEANVGYRISAMDLEQYLPWILGGAALLFVVPMVMNKR